MPVPLVSWWRAMIASMWRSHSSTCGQVVGVVRCAPRPAWVVSQPGKPPASTSALMYGPGPGDHVQPDLVRDVEQLVHVAHAGEVVDARLGRVVGPVEVDRDGVVAVGLHLLQDVPPQVGARQPERVELAGPDVDAAGHRPCSEYLSHVTVCVCAACAAGAASANMSTATSNPSVTRRILIPPDEIDQKA